MRPSARLSVLHKSGVSALDGCKATLTGTRHHDRGVIQLAFLRNDQRNRAGVTAVGLTIPQAMRLRSELAAAIRAVLPDEDAAPAGVSFNADSTAPAAGSEDRRHGSRQGTTR